MLFNNEVDLSLSCIRPSITQRLALFFVREGFLPFSANFPSSFLLSEYVKIKQYEALIHPVFLLYSTKLVANSDYATKNVWMIMNWNGCAKTQSWLILSFRPSSLLEGLRKPKIKLSWNSVLAGIWTQHLLNTICNSLVGNSTYCFKYAWNVFSQFEGTMQCVSDKENWDKLVKLR